jgi:hypothetical protein
MKFRSIVLAGGVLAAAAADVPSCSPEAYGQTGNRLPALVKDAVAALSKIGLEGLPRMAVSQDQIVVVKDLDKFAACRGFADPDQVEWVRKTGRMFTLAADFPIYVGGYRQDFAGAVRAYGDGKDYVRYLYAAWIAHEWSHANFREEGEVFPYQTELRVELYFAAKGLLPSERDNAYIQETRARLEMAQAAGQAGNVVTGPAISLGRALDAAASRDQTPPPIVQLPPDSRLPPDTMRSLADMTVPVVVEGSPIPKASARKLIGAWNNLIAGFKAAEGRFTADENMANDAILMQIQRGLLALGRFRASSPTAASKGQSWHDVSQLIPNTRALEKYLARKQRENPKINDFRRLHANARQVAEQIEIVAPIISVLAGDRPPGQD